MDLKIAQPNEYQKIRDYYYSLIDAMQDAEFKPGWEKDVYPSEELLITSIDQKELYYVDSVSGIMGCMIVNHRYNEGYQMVPWSVEAADEELWVIHALGVHARFAGQGIAKQMVQAVLDMAKEQKIKTIRLDVLEGNLPAERVYTKMGFQYVSTLKMFYEDTGWTNYRLFEYIVNKGER